MICLASWCTKIPCCSVDWCVMENAFSIMYIHIVWPLWIVMLSERFFICTIFVASQFWHNNFLTILHKVDATLHTFAYISPSLPVATEEVPHQMQMLEFWMHTLHIAHATGATCSIPPFRMECICWMVCSLLFCTRRIYFRLIMQKQKKKIFIVAFEYSFTVRCSYRSNDRYTIELFHQINITLKLWELFTSFL